MTDAERQTANTLAKSIKRKRVLAAAAVKNLILASRTPANLDMSTDDIERYLEAIEDWLAMVLLRNRP
jgi:uncharacterized membrane protein